MKRKISLFLSLCLLLGCVSLTACEQDNASMRGENVLRVASWDEYIDMGGEDSYYSASSLPLYEEFESWYEENYHEKIKVEYVALQDNETMYGKIKLGDFYDLLCPSEYMMMKLANEGRLEPLPQSFFDTTDPLNYYIQGVSPYIQGVLTDNGWSEYTAGYMWGTTGFVFNPEEIERERMTSWNVLKSEHVARKITAKDNVRDAYFIGLGMHYENLIAEGKLTKEDFLLNKKRYMNDTSKATISAAQANLLAMRKNLYGLETDEGKEAVIAGRLDAAFQWSGDGVYILDQAEENDIYLEYAIPELVSNLWFDGWVMMKGANVKASTAFINFLSMQQNAVRNMSYIGYTSCMAGEVVFDYVKECYEETDGDEECDLSYFFGENSRFTTSKKQKRRQLGAQYPDSSTIERLVVMEYFDADANERANRMWQTIK